MMREKILATPIELQRRKWLLGAVILTMVIWGLNWPSGKILSAYTSSENLAFMRFTIVFLSMLPFVIIKGVNLRIKKKGLPILLLGGALLALYNYIFLKGLFYGFAGAGGVLVCTLNPIFAYVLGLIIEKRKPTKNEYIGLMLGLIAGGFLLKIWGKMSEVLNAGNIFFLSAAIIWALMSKITSRSGKYGDIMGFSLWLYFLTAIFLFPLCNFQEIVLLVRFGDMVFWGNMLFFAVVATTIATSIYFYATTHLGAEVASSFIFLVPVTVAFSSWIILKETIELHTIIGGILGIFAVILINKVKIPGRTPFA